MFDKLYPLKHQKRRLREEPKKHEEEKHTRRKARKTKGYNILTSLGFLLHITIINEIPLMHLFS
ncbi:MAG: hypothetical protein J7L82_04485 [Staphylothermus sp.]|nr:hypothetical protein [Staphylothermus sp.]